MASVCKGCLSSFERADDYYEHILECEECAPSPAPVMPPELEGLASVKVSVEERLINIEITLANFFERITALESKPTVVLPSVIAIPGVNPDPFAPKVFSSI